MELTVFLEPYSEAFDTVVKLCKLALPVSTAFCERSFSVLKLFKTHLKNISNEQFGCFEYWIEQKRSINLNSFVDIYSRRHGNRKCTMCFSLLTNISINSICFLSFFFVIDWLAKANGCCRHFLLSHLPQHAPIHSFRGPPGNQTERIVVLRGGSPPFYLKGGHKPYYLAVTATNYCWLPGQPHEWPDTRRSLSLSVLSPRALCLLTSRWTCNSGSNIAEGWGRTLDTGCSLLGALIVAERA